MGRTKSYILRGLLGVALAGATAQELPAPTSPERAPVVIGATKGSEFHAADGLENWSIGFDTSGLKPGTYNILARATDSAGNVAFSAPFDIVIDPASDLPVVGLVNPLPLARVGADLNVVGTCVDDDGVDYVEVRVDDGPWTRAEGGEYWSYYLSTAALADGMRTLAARGVDVNGVAGPEETVSFHLDRTKPAHDIRAPGFGAIVSGRITVSGVMSDANGIASAAYSSDSGKTWVPLRYGYDKRALQGSFSVSIDTRALPDGPSVLWLRSVDGVGSEGRAVFLFFVDNTKPELVIASPAEGESVNGRFELRGRVSDAVGIASLAWESGKETGTVELLPGNPYFSMGFEAPAKPGSFSVKLSARDVAGNVTTLVAARPVDPAADLPTVSLALPAEGRGGEGALLIAGEARDDDGVASVTWRIDDGPEESLATDGAFAITVPSLAAGERTLWLRAIDVNGLAGPWLRRAYRHVGPAPRFASFEATDSLGGRRPFRPGDALSALDGKATVYGLVEAANPLVRLAYSVNGSAAVALPLPKGAGSHAFSVPIGSDLPFGVLELRLEAEDAEGRLGVARLPLASIDYSRPRAGPLVDFGLAESTDGGPRPIVVLEGRPASGRFIAPFGSDGPRSVRLDPSSTLVAAAIEGDRVIVSQLADGATEPTTVIVETERGHAVAAGPFVFATDATAPELRILDPDHGSWLSGVNELRVAASDGDTVAGVEYSLDGGEWLPMAADGDAYRATFDASAPSLAAGLPAPGRLDVRARDRTGNEARAMTAFMSDAAAPALARILPRDGDEVAGPTLFAVSLGERLESIASVELTRDGAVEALEPAGIMTFSADVPAGADPSARALVLRAVDRAGNATELDLLAGLSRAAEPRVALPPAPRSGQATEGKAAGDTYLNLSGSDAAGAVSWGAPFGPRPAPADAPADDSADAPIKALRVSGELKATMSLSGLSLDPKKPSATWSVGSGSAPTPIALKKGSAPGDWIASLRLPPAPDGPAVLSITVQDLERGELTSMVALDYDSTPPSVDFLAPPTSGTAAGRPFAVVLRASDARGIASLSYEYGKERGELHLLPGSGDAAATFALDAKAKSVGVVIVAVDGTGNASRSTLIVTASPEAAIASPPEPEVFAPAEPPVLSLPELAPGSSLVVAPKAALSLVAKTDSSLRSASVSLNGGEWQTLKLPKAALDGSYAIAIPLPQDLSYERHRVACKAVDANGTESTLQSSFYRVAEPRPGLAVSAVTAEGLYASSLDAGERLALSRELPLDILFYGRPLASVVLDPPVPFAEASFEGSRVSLLATADGLAESLTLRVKTVDGDEFSLGPLPAVADSGAPAVTILEPRVGLPVAGPFTLSGEAADPNGVTLVEYSLDGGLTWTGADAALADAKAGAPTGAELTGGAATRALRFSARVEPSAGLGARPLLVRAVDGSGAARRALSVALLDAEPPLATLETPRPGDTVNGTVLVSGRIHDYSSLASLEYSPDGTTWEPLPFSPSGAEAAAGEARGPEPEPSTRSWAFSRLVDLGALPDGGAAMAFRAVDASGNAVALAPLSGEPTAFVVDSASDKPAIEIQIPAENEVIRSDLTVSGMAFDDDGVAELFWRLDGGEWTRLDGANGFAVALRLADLADNEHGFEAYAVDLNGVRGETAARRFRVSREEPVGLLATPDVSVVNRGSVELGGTASDANGIASVQVSFDHGATYNAATGTTEWRYRLDTRILPDGVHSVYLRLADGYDTPGFAAGLLAVDNTPPALSLDVPADGWEGVSRLTVGGRSSDAIGLAETTIALSRLGSDAPERIVSFAGDGVFSRELDLGGLAPGWYNVKVSARDRAGNQSHQSRNVVVLESARADYAEIVFPASGERLAGRFTLDGRVVSAEPIERANVTLNGRPFATVTLGPDGWFSLPVLASDLAGLGPAGAAGTTGGEGTAADAAMALSFRVEAVSGSGAPIASEPRSVSFERHGPWVDIGSVLSGDFVVGRPYLTGTAGWAAEEPAPDDREAVAAFKRLQAARRPVLVEVSRDNGKTYERASGATAFKHRLETQEYPNGTLRLTVVATFADGSVAVRKRMVVLDTEAPRVRLLKPAQNGRYNGVVSIEGVAADPSGLKDVSVALRSGDKASYEVPAFIQGSYADLHLFGATRAELGLGLSFFEDNVKLQVALGQGFDAQPSWDNPLGLADDDTPAAELSRFRGYVIGAKLLANLAYLPFAYYFGPDWDFYSMSFALGASFTYFSMRSDLSQLLSPPEGRYMILAGVTGQWEFAKFKLDLPALKSIGLYVEGGFVFIPSEASTRLEEFIRPNVAFGLRLGIF